MIREVGILRDLLKRCRDEQDTLYGVLNEEQLDAIGTGEIALMGVALQKEAQRQKRLRFDQEGGV